VNLSDSKIFNDSEHRANSDSFRFIEFMWSHTHRWLDVVYYACIWKRLAC